MVLRGANYEFCRKSILFSFICLQALFGIDCRGRTLILTTSPKKSWLQPIPTFDIKNLIIDAIADVKSNS